MPLVAENCPRLRKQGDAPPDNQEASKREAKNDRDRMVTIGTRPARRLSLIVEKVLVRVGRIRDAQGTVRPCKRQAEQHCVSAPERHGIAYRGMSGRRATHPSA